MVLVSFPIEEWVERRVNEIKYTCYIKLEDSKALFVNIETI